MDKNISISEAYELMFRDYPDVINIKELSEMLGICSIQLKKQSAIYDTKVLHL